MDPNLLTGQEIVNGSSSASFNSSTFDASNPQWTYGVFGRRSMFRPALLQTGYKDAEDYYRRSYDPLSGARVAIALGSLMLFICFLAIYNRYGIFRKKRHVTVSRCDSMGHFEAIQWLQMMKARNQSPVYNPFCSETDLPKLHSAELASSGPGARSISETFVNVDVNLQNSQHQHGVPEGRRSF